MELTRNEVECLGKDRSILKQIGLDVVEIPTEKIYEFINKIYNENYTVENSLLLNTILAARNIQLCFVDGYSRLVPLFSQPIIRMNEDIVVNLWAGGNGFHPDCACHEMRISGIWTEDKHMELVAAYADFLGFELTKEIQNDRIYICIKNRFRESQLIYVNIFPHNNGLALNALRRIPPEITHKS